MVASSDRIGRVKDILRSHSPVFKPINEHPAKLTLFAVHLLPGTRPIKQRCRPLVPDKAKFVEDDIQRQLALGVIRPVKESMGIAHSRGDETE